MMKLEKVRKFIAVFTIAAAMVMPCASVHAVEISGDTMEVSKDEKSHTVAVYGNAVAFVYPEGQMTIIANNPSGRIDVMLDGKVTKGLGTVIVPAENRTNMILEEGSLVASVMNEEQADALKKMITESLLTDQPIGAHIEIEIEEEMQNINALIVGKGGDLLTEDGIKASSDVFTGVEVKTPQTVYEEFAVQMEEKIQEEQQRIQEEQEEEAQRKQEAEGSESKGTSEGSQGNGITGVCSHEWVEEGTIVDGPHSGEKYFKCKKCGIIRV